MQILKEYHTLKQKDIENLSTATREEFEQYVDFFSQNDYKHIPAIIKLPKMNETLARQLGIVNDNFLLKDGFTHFRFSRKSEYDQALRSEEVKAIYDIIPSAKAALVDTIHKNFNLYWADTLNADKVNILIFNKDVLGNYIVTAKKVNKGDLNKREYIQVGEGVAPSITRP